MIPTTPTSPTFVPMSPLTPHSPSMGSAHLMEPLAQTITTFSPEGTARQVLSPTFSMGNHPWSQNAANMTILRRNSNAMSLCSPRDAPAPPSTPVSTLYSVRKPERVYPQKSPSAMLREDGRQSRLAMRSPQFDRVMTLPLRVNTSMFPNFTAEPAAPISENQTQDVRPPLPKDQDLFDWLPTRSPTSPISRTQPKSPSRAMSRSPIHKHFRGRHAGRRLPPPPKYHVTISQPPSPTTQYRKQQYLHGIEHLRAPLVPLISVSNGLPHPAFPISLLQYHLLTHEQLDSLAKWYHQVTPAVEETFMYPAWIPAWAGPAESEDSDGVHLETKRRRWGRFIGLRGCDSPTTIGPAGERPDELVQRMEREWRRALERAEEEDRVWEKSWRGRW